jgi:hypothetical protein
MIHMIKLETYLNADDTAAVKRAGSFYADQATAIVYHAGSSFPEGDAKREYISTELAAIVAKSTAFTGRYVAEHVSQRKAGHGIVITKRKDGKFAVLVFTTNAEGVREHINLGVFKTQRQARDIANQRWLHGQY